MTLILAALVAVAAAAPVGRQRELATRSPQAEHIVAARAGHFIQNQEPGLVIDAVRRVVAKATTR